MPKAARNKILKFAIIALVWLTFDRLAKAIIVAADNAGQSVTSGSWLGIFHITFVKNTGAAFGSFSGSGIFLIVVSAVLVLLMLGVFAYCLHAEQSGSLPFSVNYSVVVPVALIVAGGISNLYDRIAYGFVVDYICLDFIDFPVFNIADIGVTCGAFFLVIYMIFVLFKSSNLPNHKNKV